MAIFAHVPGGEDFDDIDEDKSAKRIGERIKRIREVREMTRAELGSYIELDQNRIQQYENGRRKPKMELLRRIAAILGVEPRALMDSTVDSYVGAMYVLFQMEENMNLKVLEKDGCYYLQFGDGKTDRMNDYLKQWHTVRKELDEALPNLSDEEREKKIFDYNMFEWTYPKRVVAQRRYNEHTKNRITEMKENKEWTKSMIAKMLEKSDQKDEE